VFVSSDWTWATVPREEGAASSTTGDGWTLRLAPGWEGVQKEGRWVISKAP